MRGESLPSHDGGATRSVTPCTHGVMGASLWKGWEEAVRIDIKLTFHIDTKTGGISVFDDHTGRAITGCVRDFPETHGGALEPGHHNILAVSHEMGSLARDLLSSTDSPVLREWLAGVVAEWRENNPE